jgi:hypothetical protein
VVLVLVQVEQVVLQLVAVQILVQFEAQLFIKLFQLVDWLEQVFDFVHQ